MCQRVDALAPPVMPVQTGTHDKLQRDRFRGWVEVVPHRYQIICGPLSWVPFAIPRVRRAATA